MYSMLSTRDVAQSLGPEQFFQDTGSPSGVPQEIAGRIISAVLEVISAYRSLSSLLPRVLSNKKVESIPNIDLYLATSNDMERFIRSMPQYFTISGSHVRRGNSFTEDVFNAAIRKRALEIHPSSNVRKGLAAAALGVPNDLFRK